MEKIQMRRRNYFIDKNFQTKFILRFCFLILIGSFLFATIVYYFGRGTSTVTFLHAKAKVVSTADFLFPILMQTIIVVTIFVSIFTVILTLFFSHKIAGPLYRLKKELDIIERGILNEGFCIRKKDQLQDLALSLSLMLKTLREKINILKRDWQDLKDSLEKKEGIEEKIKKIDKNLDYFKI
ncbi:MAG: hypothetical protein NC918_02175 [Candidatus Omnitrophica bacterium]|nr:hypothetical protein [Candidatus Omnitrophota bacterium]